MTVKAQIRREPLPNGMVRVTLLEGEEVEAVAEVPADLLAIAIERLRRDEDGLSYAPLDIIEEGEHGD